MTNSQRWISNFIDKNFVSGSVKKELLDDDKIKITDETGKSFTLTMNLYGDIMLAGTKTIIAESDLPHTLDDMMRRPFATPRSWTNLPVNWTQVKQETKTSIKAQISYYKSQMEKDEKKNSILQKEEREHR
ncbi:MAG: hypothetical protein ACI4VG_06535 [Lachnospiraceae bacterium]